MRANGDQRRPLGLGLLEEGRGRLAVEELRARRGSDRFRLGQGRLGPLLQELRGVLRSHARVRRLGEVRNCRDEEATVAFGEATGLPDGDQALRSAVDAAEDAGEDPGLVRLHVTRHLCGARHSESSEPKLVMMQLSDEQRPR